LFSTVIVRLYLKPPPVEILLWRIHGNHVEQDQGKVSLIEEERNGGALEQRRSLHQPDDIREAFDMRIAAK
jgi:hypothetical protein